MIKLPDGMTTESLGCMKFLEIPNDINVYKEKKKSLASLNELFDQQAAFYAIVIGTQ